MQKLFILLMGILLTAGVNAQVIKTSATDTSKAGRANDRLRTAGPKEGWWNKTGSIDSVTNNKEQQQVKSIVLQAYESISLSARQWFAAVSSAGDIDSAYIKRKLKEKFSIGQLENEGNLFALMIAYQQMLNKEARADRKMDQQLKRLFLAGKEEKIQMNNEAIDQGMKEAREKAGRAMDAAASSLVTGIVSGLMQISFIPNSKPGQPKATVADYIKKLDLQLVKLKKDEEEKEDKEKKPQ